LTTSCGKFSGQSFPKDWVTYKYAQITVLDNQGRKSPQRRPQIQCLIIRSSIRLILAPFLILTHMDPKLAPTASFLCGLSPHLNLAFALCRLLSAPAVKWRDIAGPGGLSSLVIFRRSHRGCWEALERWSMRDYTSPITHHCRCGQLYISAILIKVSSGSPGAVAC
jgi:hypothetical protein